MRTIGVILFIPFLAWSTIRIVAAINFDRNCEGFLKRAADSNKVERAHAEMVKAVKYLEDNRLTSGYTSVLYTTPDEDIGFWYENLRDTRDDLAEFLKKIESGEEVTALERSNVLMKVRETLLDEGQSVGVTVPDGISVYPHNVGLCWFGILSTIALVGGCACIIATLDV